MRTRNSYFLDKSPWIGVCNLVRALCTTEMLPTVCHVVDTLNRNECKDERRFSLSRDNRETEFQEVHLCAFIDLLLFRYLKLEHVSLTCLLLSYLLESLGGRSNLNWQETIFCSLLETVINTYKSCMRRGGIMSYYFQQFFLFQPWAGSWMH